MDKEERTRIKNKIHWIPLLVQNKEYNKAVEDCEEIIQFFKDLRDEILERKEVEENET